MVRHRILSHLLKTNACYKTCYMCALKSTHQQRSFNLWASSQVRDWNKAVSEAEKIVGYPTSFLSLRCFLSDELSNVALHMRKLVGTKHPLLKTARKFFYDGKHNMQTRGLIVLLISKAAGPGPEMFEQEHAENVVSGIHSSQRSLAEITEMIHTANLIHKGVVNLDSVDTSDGSLKDMEFGNNMAVLSGDFLLANASTGLADLHNTYVVELISSAIGNLMEAEFTKLRDKDGFSVIPPGGVTIEDWEKQTYLASGGVTIEDWEKQTYLASGSLLAKACKSAMLLAEHPEEVQEKAYTFGKHAAYAYQIREDVLPFTKRGYEDNGDSNGATVTSLPVIIQLQHDKSLLNQLQSSPPRDSHSVLKLVTEPKVIQECKDFCKHHGQIALDSLKQFEKSESRTALENIVHAVTYI